MPNQFFPAMQLQGADFGQFTQGLAQGQQLRANQMKMQQAEQAATRGELARLGLKMRGAESLEQFQAMLPQDLSPQAQAQVNNFIQQNAGVDPSVFKTNLATVTSGLIAENPDLYLGLEQLEAKQGATGKPIRAIDTQTDELVYVTPQQVLADQKRYRPEEKTPATSITVGADGVPMTPGQKKLSEGQGTRVEGFIGEGSDAITTQTKIDQALSVVDQADTSALAPLGAFVGGYADALGISIDKNKLTARQSMSAVTNSLTLDELSKLKGGSSDKEINFVKATTANAGNTPEANKFSLNGLKSAAILKQRRGEYLSEQTLNGVPPGRALADWNKMARKTPFVSMKVKDANGLPVYFENFRAAFKAKPRNAEATEMDIIEAWKESGH